MAKRELVDGGNGDLDLARVGGVDDQVHDAGASQGIALLVGGRLAQVEQTGRDLVDLDALTAPSDHPGIRLRRRDRVYGCRHRRPSWAISWSACSGPQLPAGYRGISGASSQALSTPARRLHAVSTSSRRANRVWSPR